MFKIHGFDQLEKLQRRIEDLDGTHNVPFDEAFSPDFMVEFTDFSSIDEMLQASGYKADTPEDFAAIPDDDWDAFVSRSTRFATWEDMRAAAGERWVQKRLLGE